MTISKNLFNIYVNIRQYFQPYWYPLPDALKKKKQQKTKTKRADNGSNEIDIKQKLIEKFGFYPSQLKIRTVDRPLTNIFKVKQFPNKGEIWYYHDSTYHQIIAHVGSGGRSKFKERSSEERALLKPLLYPKENKAFDRTHMIPFGYVGTENDPRIVIGWSSIHNQNELNDFEIRQSNRQEDIYWYTGIIKTKYGATWQSVVVSVDTGRLLDSIQLKIGTSSKPVEFYWKDN